VTSRLGLCSLLDISGCVSQGHPRESSLFRQSQASIYMYLLPEELPKESSAIISDETRPARAAWARSQYEFSRRPRIRMRSLGCSIVYKGNLVSDGSNGKVSGLTFTIVRRGTNQSAARSNRGTPWRPSRSVRVPPHPKRKRIYNIDTCHQ
jgi:hypothetical protein